MTHCVPDWDGHGGELDAVIATTDFLPPVKGKRGSSLLPKRSPPSDLGSLQSSDVPSGWTENGTIALKPDVNGTAKGPDWQVNCNHWTSTGRPETEDVTTPSKSPTSEPPPPVTNGVLAVNVPVLDRSMTSSIMADDEMALWLQYPLDDSLERSYCSDFFGELPNSTENSMQAIKDSLAVGQHATAAGRSSCRNLPIVTGAMNGSMNRVVSADAAMAMGAGRAAGVLPQAGVEAFTKVRTQQPYSGKWAPNSSTGANPGKTVGAAAGIGHTSTSPNHLQQEQQHTLRASPVEGASPGIPNMSSSMLLPPPKAQPLPQARSFSGVKKGPINFSHFSVPAVNMKANLQCLGIAQVTPAQNRSRSPYLLPNMPTSGTRPFDATTSSGSSIAESTTTRLHSEDASRNNDSSVRAVNCSSEGQQPSVATESSWPSSMPNSLSSTDAEVAVKSTTVNHVDFECRPADQHESRPVEPETRRNSIETSNAVAPPSMDMAVTPPAQNPEPPEPTLTSSSGGSGNTSKGVAPSRSKRRSRDQEDSEIQSDEAEDEVVELKKPPQRSNPSKRTRAAEVHNLSERRRRDRINEKMKALQELIPNSNKADKASMLDEAIEYLKMLQIQLQMMSMRSGMSIPSMIPNGIQHLQVSQMGGMPPMGLGMGMGMGMAPIVGIGGMGPMPMGQMLDINSMAAAGRPSHLIPHLGAHGHGHGGAASHSGSPMMPHHQMPTHGGASYNVSQVMPHHTSPLGGASPHSLSATSPAVSMVDSHQDLRLQSNASASALESAYLARQHPLHLTPQTMDVYNAYMIHQQQQHQYQQQQHQQQQQAQHLHHLPGNMGSGALQ